MDEKKIEITEKDLVKALAHVVAEDEDTNELIVSVPSLLLLFPIIIRKIWEQLTSENKEDE